MRGAAATPLLLLVIVIVIAVVIIPIVIVITAAIYPAVGYTHLKGTVEPKAHDGISRNSHRVSANRLSGN